MFFSLKLDNILINSDGYLKLADFGLSKRQKEEGKVCLCGTPQYLAPEVVKDEHFGMEIDWWGLGCILYEFLHGFPPFFSNENMNNKEDLFKRIIENKVKFHTKIGKYLKNLIELLLIKNPKERLGSKNDAIDIKKHEWFDNFDWNKLTKKKLVPPFIPHLKSEIDVSYFDIEYTQANISTKSSVITESSPPLIEGKLIGIHNNY